MSVPTMTTVEAINKATPYPHVIGVSDVDTQKTTSTTTPPPAAAATVEIKTENKDPPSVNTGEEERRD